MISLIPHLYSFIIPLFIANIAHMLIVKFNIFDVLAKPLSSKLFGESKTYRGFVVLPLVCALVSLISEYIYVKNISSIYFINGFVLGFVYAIAELPTSYFKRKIGIVPGQSKRGYRIIQLLIDKTDSLLLLCFVYYFMVEIAMVNLLKLFCVSFLIHISFSYILFILKIKKTI